MTTPDGVTVAGQPEVAAAWFPVNDHPIDKASYSFDVTVPDGYEVVANGFLRDRDDTRRLDDLASGRRASRWRRTSPPSTSGTGTSTRGARRAASRSTTRSTRRSPAGCARRSTRPWPGRARSSTSSSDAFGPYPFSTVGAIVDNQDDLFFALETQTRPVYSKYFWLDGEGNPINGDFVVVHELAHQWFGDDVALARWQDIWLNEGFATYAEWLWAEYEGSRHAAGDLPGHLRRHPRRRPVLGRGDRRPGSRPAVRQRRSTSAVR